MKNLKQFEGFEHKEIDNKKLLDDTYKTLKETFKDNKKLGIYTGDDYNKENIKLGYKDNTIDDPKNSLVVCGKLDYTGDDYLDGAYGIEIENGQPIMIWWPYPEEPIKGVDAIIKTIKEFSESSDESKEIKESTNNMKNLKQFEGFQNEETPEALINEAAKEERIDSKGGSGFMKIKRRGGEDNAIDITIEFQESFREGLAPDDWKEKLIEAMNKMGEIFDTETEFN